MALVSGAPACSDAANGEPDGASDAIDAARDAADPARSCAQTLAEACADAGTSTFLASACCTEGPGCVGRLPATLAPFCASRVQGDAGVLEIPGCYGLTVVVAPGAIDTSALYFYDANGLLVALGGWLNAREKCYAGPADFVYPIGGHSDPRTCPSISSPQCCASLPPAASYGCPVGGDAGDAAPE
jgi:hypothetical protein